MRMRNSLTRDSYPKQKRQEVFQALVVLQDDGMSWKDSRYAICKRFSITSAALLDIEREGINDDWPPLHVA
jgi:hypothetical protein|tara:strand:+ start:1321 stop:1533 length:213 start_codon:yes stop_codon:yes gene_type:complete